MNAHRALPTEWVAAPFAPHIQKTRSTVTRIAWNPDNFGISGTSDDR